MPYSFLLSLSDIFVFVITCLSLRLISRRSHNVPVNFYVSLIMIFITSLLFITCHYHFNILPNTGHQKQHNKTGQETKGRLESCISSLFPTVTADVKRQSCRWKARGSASKPYMLCFVIINSAIKLSCVWILLSFFFPQQKEQRVTNIVSDPTDWASRRHWLSGPGTVQFRGTFTLNWK